MVASGSVWLLIDSTADPAWLALADGSGVRVERRCAGREFSAQWSVLLREALDACGWRATELTAIAVVNGPGSFTGVRVGLAMAKGLAEATGAKLVAVSKLALVARAADGATPILDAGRGRVFTVDREGRELTREMGTMLGDAGDTLATSDAELAAKHSCTLVGVDAALLLAEAERLAAHGDFADAASLDANYVASEEEIYGHVKRAATTEASQTIAASVAAAPVKTAATEA